MKPPLTTRLAGLLGFVVLALYAAGLALTLLNNPGWLRDGPLVFLENLWVIVVFAVCGGMGAFVAARRPHNAVGWLMLAVGGLAGLALAGEQVAIYSLMTRPGAWPTTATALAVWVSFPAWHLAIGLLFTLLLLVFPTGRPPSPRWRPVAWAAGVLVALATVYVALAPYTDPPMPGLANPLAIDALGAVDMDLWLLGPLAALSLVCAASLVVRFRTAGPEERQQMKWFLYAAALLAAGMLLEALSQLLLPALAPLAFVVLDVGYTALPVAVGLAVLRYRLWDIDILIRRTLLYAALSAALAAVYFGSVVVLQGLLRLLTGQAQAQGVTVLSTLVIAALFQPLRQRLQQAIDRRFYRRKYDAARILDGFGAAVRDEVDLDALAERLLAAVADTVQPAHVSLWVRPEPGPSSPPAQGRIGVNGQVGVISRLE